MHKHCHNHKPINMYPFFPSKMATISQYITNIQQLTQLTPLTTNCYITLLLLASLFLLFSLHRKTATIYLLDFSCYRPPGSCRLPASLFLESVSLDPRIDAKSVAFQAKIIEKSGFSNETCIPHSLNRMPIKKSVPLAVEEGLTIMSGAVNDLFEKIKIAPEMIDILITHSSMFSPTPSLSAMLVSKFGMRSDIKSFNLSGMGCSAGIVAVSVARDLLRVRSESLALVVSTEILGMNWYGGKNPSMLLSNCLFRMGGSALILSNRGRDKKSAKYMLQHLVRTNKAQNDESYACVYLDEDSENEVGVAISKSILSVAGEALKTNIATLGPLVLPFSEQIVYGLSVIRKRVKNSRTYTPNFRKAFKHFCVHAGGKAIIEAVKEKLGLSEEDVEASKMTLYRFGNTSSSSVWYSLCYTEAKERVKKGDTVWQIAFGSGFKCGSAVWKCLSDVRAETNNAWGDMINSYPVEIPEKLI